MLVLKITHDEKIIVGDPEKPIGSITLLRARNGEVRLGFDLPKYLDLNRESIAKRKVEEAAKTRKE